MKTIRERTRILRSSSDESWKKIRKAFLLKIASTIRLQMTASRGPVAPLVTLEPPPPGHTGLGLLELLEGDNFKNWFFRGPCKNLRPSKLILPRGEALAAGCRKKPTLIPSFCEPSQCMGLRGPVHACPPRRVKLVWKAVLSPEFRVKGSVRRKVFFSGAIQILNR